MRPFRGTGLPLVAFGGVMQVFVLMVLAGATWYFMSTEDRTRFLRAVGSMLDRLRRGVIASCFASDPLTDALRARTRWLVVVPAIAVVNVAVFGRMLLPSFDIGPDTVVAWGGNFAPRTGNGEWWRLISATFVHSGTLSLLVNTGAVLSAGRVLERLVGSVTFGVVYVVAGAMGALASLWISPVAVTAGASAAVFGVYGLLLACWMWGAFRRSTTTVRLASIRALAVPAVLFIGYNLATGDLATSAEIAGVVSGFMSGLLLARSAAERKPALPRVAAAAAAAAVILFVLAEPVRGLVDPREEIAAVIAMETRTSARYDAAVARFSKGSVSAGVLASLIERAILPELKATNRRVHALGRVAADQQDAVEDARDYLRMREESWRLKALALQKASMPLLRQADQNEKRALDAFDKFKTSAGRIGTRLTP